MRREKVGKIVPIGQGLCRVIVRSEKLADRLGSVPGVQVRAEDTEHLGWWIIFPEEMRPLIEPVFRGKTIVTDKPVQLNLIDENALTEGETSGSNGVSPTS
jgi:hypothetical protein